MAALSAFGSDNATGAGKDDQPVYRTLTSHSYRFIITSTNSADNLRWATWAENVTDKTALRLGRNPSFRREFPIRITLYDRIDRKVGEIRLEQDEVHGHLVQNMILINPRRLDGKDVLDKMVELLLVRYAYVYRPLRPDHAGLASIPGWMYAGLAQNLDASFRFPNMQTAIDRWLGEGDISLSRILTWDTLPPDAAHARAVASMFMDWMQAHIREPVFYQSLMQRLAEGGEITPEWLVMMRPQYESVRDLEQDWDLWIARHLRVRKPEEGITVRALAELRALRTVKLDSGRGYRPIEITLSDLIHYREEDWVPALAWRMSVDARSLSIGQIEEYRNVAMLYARFFDALQEPRSRWRSASAHQQRLEDLLNRAEEALIGLEKSLDEEALKIDD